MPSEEVVKEEPIDLNSKVADLTVGQLFNLLNAVVERAANQSMMATTYAINQAKQKDMSKGIIKPFPKPIIH